MKRAYLFFGTVLASAIGIAYAYNGMSSGDFSASGFLAWVESFMTRVQLKIDNFAGGGDPVAIAADFIAGQEGFSSKTYIDQTGNPTIGYGHKLIAGDGFDANSTISEPDARALLVEDMANATSCVYGYVNATLTPNQAASLISLCYNIGCGNFSSSTLVKNLNNGNIDGASAEFGRWVYGTVNGSKQVVAGLQNRREAEQELFNS